MMKVHYDIFLCLDISNKIKYKYIKVDSHVAGAYIIHPPLYALWHAILGIDEQ